MKIAIDATPLSVPTGGIRRYVSELTNALLDLGADSNGAKDDLWYFSDQPFAAPPGVHSAAPPRNPIDRRWWLLGAARELARHGMDVFHGTDFAVPYLPRCASVLTLHDLSPWRDSVASSSRVRNRTKALLRLRVPTLILTPSDAIRREAIGYFGWPESRIVAVPLAPADWLKPAPSAPEGLPYFLHVGALEPRKNVAAIVEAWRLLPAGGSRLVLAGRPRPDFALPRPAPGLEILTDVPDGQLAALYSNAAAVLCLSSYEGFGLPVLEAMRCGAPVIASNDPAIRETAGGAACIADSRDPKSVAEAMLAMIANPNLRADLSARGSARASLFTWSRTARETRAAYAEAVARHAR